MTDQEPVAVSYRNIVRSSLRAIGTVAVLTTLYYLLPLDRVPKWLAVGVLVAGLSALVALVVYQVRSVLSSARPVLRAVEALAMSVPWFLLLFAGTYVAMQGFAPHSFSQSLTHTDALYFTVTVFATVGFGDIVPTTEAARLVVTVQMITDLVVIGIAIKAITGAVQRRRQR
jgi:voltage-gated potassium channel